MVSKKTSKKEEAATDIVSMLSINAKTPLSKSLQMARIRKALNAAKVPTTDIGFCIYVSENGVCGIPGIGPKYQDLLRELYLELSSAMKCAATTKRKTVRAKKEK